MTVQFSIIVPTYNRAHLIQRCLDSILKQDYEDYEIIVVDDGSQDNTREVVQEFMKQDDRIRYVCQSNLGGGDARNRGVAESRAEWITFIDSDDEVHSDWLKSFYEGLVKQSATVACCGSTLINSDGSIDRVRLPKRSTQQGEKPTGLYISGTFALKKSVFQMIGGYKPGLPANQHSELRMRLIPLCEKNGWTIHCFEESLVKRYSHEGPNIRSNDKAKYESGTYILNEHGDKLKINPRSYASWATATGGCAARLGRYQDARKWFGRAVSTYPKDIKNYARWMIALTPFLRSYVWGRSESLS